MTDGGQLIKRDCSRQSLCGNSKEYERNKFIHMKKIRRKKMWLDAAILVAAITWVFAAYYYKLPNGVIYISLFTTILLGGISITDFIKLTDNSGDSMTFAASRASAFSPHELILLNEHEKPIRSWDLTGKISMIIGRKNKDEEVDIDLCDCEYSALINIQHAVLNFSLDRWYLEDLGNGNGVRIKKADDGNCYQVAPNRPVIINVGDVIYIAKTRLLLT